MTSNASGARRIIGTLRSEEGSGVVRLEDRFDTDIGDLWSALTDPARLARWYGEVEGDLRQGGEFRSRLYGSGWEGTSRIEACEPPHRFLIVGKETTERTVSTTEVTLTADGDQTVLVTEHRGLPLEFLYAYGAGNQIHLEDLAAYIAGREQWQSSTRMDDLMPAYKALAANLEP